MLTYLLIILLVAASAFAFMVGFALFIKVWRINPDEFAEVRRTQGGLAGMFTGKLKNPPDEYGDFRFVRGLRWNSQNGQYESQHALSSEGFRAAFPK